MYLKNWSIDGLKVEVYRRLVSHKKVPYWSEKSIKQIAVHPHLYSYVKNGEKTDQFEIWLNQKIEDPAKIPFQKIKESQPLNKEDRSALIRFAATQRARTPAFYFSRYQLGEKALRDAFPQIANEVFEKMNQNKNAGKMQRRESLAPFRYEFMLSDKEGETLLKVITTVGRTQWLDFIKRMTEVNLEIFLNRSWNIIEASPDIEWATSDNPVICLICQNGKYSFNCGISEKVAEIIFPLSPKLLLYSRLDNKNHSVDYLQKNHYFSEFIQQVILENSFMYVYSLHRQKFMFRRCPRKVSPEEYERMQAELSLWDQKNAEIESKFFL